LPYRRVYQRFILNDSASLVTQEGTEKRLILNDLSATGAGVFGDCSLNINEKVTVIISAPFFFSKPICKQAKVVWCKKIDRNLWQGGLDFGLDNKINFV